jgi:hypothetical protein
MDRFRRLFLRCLGLLLLAAATLKLHGLAIEPIRPTGWFSQPGVQFTLVLLESLLGLWFLAGVQVRQAWLVAVGLFTLFGLVSCRQGWVGETSCGCFGRLSVSPWHAFGLDVLILAALLIARPDLRSLLAMPRQRLARGLRSAVWVVAGLALIGGVLVGLAYVSFGSVPAAIAYFRGERISVEPYVVDVGEGSAGELREVFVTLTNWTNKPVQLFGGTADCSCTVLQDLPMTIPAKESRSFTVQVRLMGTSGAFTRKAAFLVNDEGFKKIDFRLTGTITRTRSVER